MTVSNDGKKRTFASCIDPAAAMARECVPGTVLEGALSISRASYLEYKEKQNPGCTKPKIDARSAKKGGSQ